MATSFRDWPWPLQALFYVGLSVVLILVGFYVPGLPLSNVRTQLQTAQAEMKPLEADVQNLRVYKQRRAELQSEMDALQKQLATLQTIVPEEKQTDQFILMVQNAAVSSGVSIRTLTAKPVANKPYYFEMPFDIQADGPYFAVLDFFSRLGRLSRIINVGDLKLVAMGKGGSGKFRMTPGTSVTGTFTITTFFTQAAPDAGQLRFPLRLRLSGRSKTMKLAKMYKSAGSRCRSRLVLCLGSRGAKQARLPKTGKAKAKRVSKAAPKPEPNASGARGASSAPKKAAGTWQRSAIPLLAADHREEGQAGRNICPRARLAWWLPRCMWTAPCVPRTE